MVFINKFIKIFFAIQHYINLPLFNIRTKNLEANEVVQYRFYKKAIGINSTNNSSLQEVFLLLFRCIRRCLYRFTITHFVQVILLSKYAVMYDKESERKNLKTIKLDVKLFGKPLHLPN